MKLKKATNIINDVCEFVVAEARKITRNSCNKFNTFLMPCPAPSSVASAITTTTTQFFQRPTNSIVKANFVGVSATGTGNFAFSGDIIGASVNTGAGTSSTGSDFQTWQSIDKLKDGMIFNSNQDSSNTVVMGSSSSSSSSGDGTMFDSVGDDESYEEENQLNRQLQNYVAARVAVGSDKGNLLNVKQHYFLSKYDQSTDNKCQYFDATHLR